MPGPRPISGSRRRFRRHLRDALSSCPRIRGAPRRTSSFRHCSKAGDIVPGNSHFDTTEGTHRIPPLPRRGLHHRRRGRHPEGAAVQGRNGHRQARKAPAREPARESPVRRADHHQQHGRRPARVDAQHPRDGRSLPPLRRAPAARLGPLRRECLFHQDPRGGLCRQDHQGDRPRNLHLCRHHDHLGQEGRRGEHGRLRGHAQRRALQAGH